MKNLRLEISQLRRSLDEARYLICSHPHMYFICSKLSCLIAESGTCLDIAYAKMKGEMDVSLSAEINLSSFRHSIKLVFL